MNDHCSEPHDEDQLVQLHEPSCRRAGGQRGDAARKHQQRRRDDDGTEEAQHDRRRTLAHVRGPARVVPRKSITGARGLQDDERDDKHADEHVPGDELVHAEDRQPFDRQRDEDHRADRSRQTGVAFDAARLRSSIAPASLAAEAATSSVDTLPQNCEGRARIDRAPHVRFE